MNFFQFSSFRSGSVLFLLPLLLLISSCRRSTLTSGHVFDNSETVVASIYGIIKNENDQPVVDADVTCAGYATKTNANGLFIFHNITTPRKATTVLVKKSQYFNGSRTIVVKKGHLLKADMILMSLGTALTFDGSSGGQVQIPGLTLQVGPNSIVDQLSGDLYTGPVLVYAHVLDPTETSTSLKMPGDLRGLTKDGVEEKKLTSYGMVAVELQDPSGKPLQIKSGKAANMKLTIPSSLLATAPQTIPLWYYDEVTGMWKEEGEAAINNGCYEGTVSHFSFWNWDVVMNAIYFDVTLVDQNNQPLAGYYVKITNPSLQTSSYGVTDNSGWVGGLVYANTNLVMTIFAAPIVGCSNTILSSVNFTTTNGNYSMGTHIVNLPTNPVCSIQGTVVDCNGIPIPNKPIFIQYANMLITSNANGNFTYHFGCTPVNLISIFAYDTTNNLKGSLSATLNPGMNNLGYLFICTGWKTSLLLDVTDSVFGCSFAVSVDPYQYSSGSSLSIDYPNGKSQLDAGSGNFFLHLFASDTSLGINTIDSVSLQRYFLLHTSACPDLYFFLDNSMVNTVEYTTFPNGPGKVEGTLDFWLKGDSTGHPYHATGNFKTFRNN